MSSRVRSRNVRDEECFVDSLLRVKPGQVLESMNHYSITTKSLPFDKLHRKCNSQSSQGQMLESTMNLSAFASTLSAGTTSLPSLGVTRDQRDSAVPDSSVAQSTLSLAMIREAFKGLLVASERSYSSSAEQRGVLEHSIEQGRPLDGQSAAFQEEKYSFKSVLEAEHNDPISNPPRFRESYVAPMAFSNIQSDAVSDS